MLERLIAFLNRQGFFISAEKHAVHDLIGFVYDGFSYRNECPHVLDLGRGQTSGADITHHGIQLLAFCRFPGRLWGRPRFVRWTECLGVAFELYVLASLLRDVPDRRTFPSVNSYKGNVARLGGDFDRLLGRAVEDPFAAYKRMVRASFRIHSEVFDAVERTQRTGVYRPGTLRRRLARIPEYLAFAHYDHLTAALNMAAYCGFTSAAADGRQTEEGFALLDASSSMLAFLEALGIGDHVD